MGGLGARSGTAPTFGWYFRTDPQVAGDYFFWDLVEQQLRSMPQPYLSLPIRSGRRLR